MTEQKPPFLAQIKSYQAQFWVANTMEIFERMSWYGWFTVMAVYVTGSVATGGLGFTTETRGALQAIVPFFLYLLPVFTGAVADRYGFKKSFIIAYLVMIVSYFMLGQFTSLPTFFLAFMFVAVGAAIFKPVVVGTVAKVTDDSNSATGFGIFYMMVNVGGFVGPIVAGLVRGWGWKYVFVVCSMWALVNLVLVLALYREPPLTAEQRSGKFSKVLDNMVEVLGNVRFFITVFVVLFALMFANLRVGWFEHFTWLHAGIFIPVWIIANFAWDLVMPKGSGVPVTQGGPKRNPLLKRMHCSNWRFALFLLIMSGFWTSFNQIFLTMPEYIRDFVDTRPLIDLVEGIVGESDPTDPNVGPARLVATINPDERQSIVDLVRPLVDGVFVPDDTAAFSTDESHQYSVIARTRINGNTDVAVSNFELGANKAPVPSTDNFLDNGGSGGPTLAGAVPALPGNAAPVRQGIDCNGNIAITDSSGEFELSDVGVYADENIGIRVAGSSPSLNKSSNAFFNESNSFPNSFSTDTQTGVSVNANAADQKTRIDAGGTPGNAGVTYEFDHSPLTEELAAARKAITDLAATDTLDTGGDGELASDLTIRLESGLNVIDIDTGGDNDFTLNNMNLVIDGPVDAGVIFRLPDNSDMLVSNSNILIGNGGIGFNSVMFFTDQTENDTHFSISNAVISGISFWSLSDAGGSIDIRNAQGCTQLVADVVALDDVRFLRGALQILTTAHFERTSRQLLFSKVRIAPDDLRAMIVSSAGDVEALTDQVVIRGRQVNPEYIVNINAGSIVLFQVLISFLMARFHRFTTMILGMLVAAVGIGLSAFAGTEGMTGVGGIVWIVAGGLLIFSFGEMMASPTSQEFVGRIAPSGKKALYMGYYFVAVALGNLFGGILSGELYGSLARDRGRPDLMWLAFGGLMLFTAVIFGVYNKFALPRHAAHSLTDEPA